MGYDLRFVEHMAIPAKGRGRGIKKLAISTSKGSYARITLNQDFL